jgi:hypothetical protein
MISTTPDIVGDAFRSFWFLAATSPDTTRGMSTTVEQVEFARQRKRPLFCLAVSWPWGTSVD